MSNIIQRGSNQVATGGGFWDEFDAKDFEPPLVTIGQPSSKKYKEGLFNFNTGLAVESIKSCKLIVAKKGRVLFDGKGATCASDNHHVPSARIKEPISQSCQGCFAAQWGESEEKNELHKRLKLTFGRDKPICAETYNLIIADQDNSPFIITLMKAQLEVVKKKLFSRLRFEFAGVNPWLVSFDLGLEKGQGVGNYYVVSFNNFNKVATDEVPGLNSLHLSLSNRAQTILSDGFEKAEEARKAKEESTPAPPPWEDETRDARADFPTDDEMPF
jgi:hypothetical protein